MTCHLGYVCLRLCLFDYLFDSDCLKEEETDSSVKGRGIPSHTLSTLSLSSSASCIHTHQPTHTVSQLLYFLPLGILHYCLSSHARVFLCRHSLVSLAHVILRRYQFSQNQPIHTLISWAFQWFDAIWWLIPVSIVFK